MVPLTLETEVELLVALGVAIAFASGACAVAAWVALARGQRTAERFACLDRLEDIAREVGRIAQGKDDLDLRRLEHVLIDIRDGQQRVEDRMLAVIESGHAARVGTQALALPGGSASALTDRVVSRLLALGYERVQLVTTPEDIARMVEGDG